MLDLRAEIFLLGIVMVIIGPVLTILASVACLGTILSGHLFPCLNDLAYVVIGGTFFVIGILTTIVGLIVSDPAPALPSGTGLLSTTHGPEIACKKCGRAYSSSLFFCPLCGQRPA